ncbi:MAG: DegT/DnrJ/EryC1/StrS family aminotransferase [Bacteroidetes bacterium]|nr:DegT/DnrJ/EryC1/StrS family aminotransferase [Bacteroidota bacterium]
MNNQFIPVNTPLLNGNEEKYLIECIRTGWISSEGPFIKQFEEKFAAYIGRAEGIAVSNGSGALDVAVQALKIGPGDEVIMPAFTIISPAQSVVRAGATPVLVESDLGTWNMDVSQIEAKITSKTKAIIVVHIYGLPVEMDPVLELCKRYGLYLIEDAAEMHGQTYKEKKCGTFGDISTFSFYPNKHITTGEGGMIMVDDATLAERCRMLRNLAIESKGRRFIHHELGWNYRMTNMQAALGLAQLEKIEEHIVKKREIGLAYDKGLKGIKGFQLPLPHTSYAQNIYWVYGLIANSEELALKTVKHLNEKGIGTRPFFWCMHEQPVFLKMNLFSNERYPNAERLAHCGFYIPSGLGLDAKEIDIIINELIVCGG